MVRDYAKRPTQQPRRKMRIAITIIVIIAAITIPVFTYYVKYQNVIHKKAQAIRKKLVIRPMNTKARVVEEPTINKQAEFDFYTILPKMQVQVPSNTPTQLQLTAPGAKNRYILQVASLQSLKQAQQLKDKLFSIGYIANITSFESKNGIIWNRVMTGPYSSLENAEEAQSKLKRQHIDSILIKLD